MPTLEEKNKGGNTFLARLPTRGYDVDMLDSSTQQATGTCMHDYLSRTLVQMRPRKNMAQSQLHLDISSVRNHIK